MTSIEQLETLRNAELYDDCKNLVIFSWCHDGRCSSLFFLSRQNFSWHWMSVAKIIWPMTNAWSSIVVWPMHIGFCMNIIWQNPHWRRPCSATNRWRKWRRPPYVSRRRACSNEIIVKCLQMEPEWLIENKYRQHVCLLKLNRSKDALVAVSARFYLSIGWILHLLL